MRTKNQKEKVSCIIPVYKSERFIHSVIKEALKQCDEVIIVDDCSPDSSIEIAEKIKSPKLRIIRLKENRGCGYAKNEGAKAASFEILVFADGDQILGKDWVKKAKQELKNNIGMVGGLRPNPCRNDSEKFMHLIYTRKISDVYPKMIDGVVMINKDTFFSCGPFYQETKRGGIQKLLSGLRKHNLKIKRLPISSIHLGEPSTIKGLLKRQWKYGKEERGIKGHTSGFDILKCIVFLSPLAIFSSLPFYLHILNYEKRFLGDILFLIKLPIIACLFMWVYYAGFLRSYLPS